MPKRVMVPLDGSALSELAIPHAIDSAGPDGTVILCRAAEQVPTPSMAHLFGKEQLEAVERQQERQNQEAESYLQTWVSRLHKEGPRILFRAIPGAGPAALPEVARDLKVDLIVMTSHGRTGLSRLLFGSVAEDLWRRSHCPVLLVRANYDKPG